MTSDEQFEALVCEYYEPLFRFAVSLTREESDARDLTQQTFYVWASKGHQLRDHSKVKTWLFTTLHRTFLKGRRKQTRFPHTDLEEVSGELPAAVPEPADQVDSSQVLSALTQVDELYQAAVALFYLQQCSYKEIASVLDVPIGTVKSRIARGITQLKEIMLSGDSPLLRPGDDKKPAICIPEQPAAGTENSPPQPDDLPKLNYRRKGYDEWDLGSTFIGQPVGG